MELFPRVVKSWLKDSWTYLITSFCKISEKIRSGQRLLANCSSANYLASKPHKMLKNTNQVCKKSKSSRFASEKWAVKTFVPQWALQSSLLAFFASRGLCPKAEKVLMRGSSSEHCGVNRNRHCSERGSKNNSTFCCCSCSCSNFACIASSTIIWAKGLASFISTTY